MAREVGPLQRYILRWVIKRKIIFELLAEEDLQNNISYSFNKQADH